MSNMLPKKKARIIAMPPGSTCGRFYRRRDGTIAKHKRLPWSSRPGYKPRKLKEAMDPKAIEEAMKQRVPERMARIIAMPPGSRCGAFRKRKDGTKVKDKEKPTRSRPCYKPPRPLKEAMEPKAIEDAMSKMRPRAKARFIALTPGSQYGSFRKRKDGTIHKSVRVPLL